MDRGRNRDDKVDERDGVEVEQRAESGGNRRVKGNRELGKGSRGGRGRGGEGQRRRGGGQGRRQGQKKCKKGREGEGQEGRGEDTGGDIGQEKRKKWREGEWRRGGGKEARKGRLGEKGRRREGRRRG